MIPAWLLALVVLFGVLAPSACGSRPGTSGTNDLGPPPDSRPEPDLAPAQGLDVLFVGTQGFSSGLVRQWAVSHVAGLPDALALRARRTALADVHLAVVSPLLPGRSVCQPPTLPKAAATLFPNPQGAMVTPGDAGYDAWQAHANGDGQECALQNYLEAAAQAIDGRNPGFPRPGALLLILIMTGPDDCSVQDLSLWDDASLWPDHYGASTRCYAPPPGFLVPLAAYGPRFRALHPQRTLVAVVGTNVEPEFQLDPIEKLIGITNRRCPFYRYYASQRLAAFVAAAQERNHPRLRALYIDIPCPDAQKIAEQIAGTVVDYGDL